MTRFNYLHNAPPNSIARIQTMRIPVQLHAPLFALFTVLVALLVVMAVLTARLGTVQAIEAAAQSRLDSSKAIVARDHLERTQVDQLLALDKRLRVIRGSGWHVATRLAAIANHLPQHVWLTAISNAPSGISLKGQAQGITAIAQTVTGFLTSKRLPAPQLVRAVAHGGSDRPGPLSFDLRIAAHR